MSDQQNQNGQNPYYQAWSQPGHCSCGYNNMVGTSICQNLAKKCKLLLPLRPLTVATSEKEDDGFQGYEQHEQREHHEDHGEDSQV
ncbi:hypothetical protein EDB82DRAFT_529782 [Fusarium venenatum]|uniref:uncharacterized protein n=1 Tax=Fusarium venenatum TaxID=56646 RepID=UPI001D1F4041|nr:hypothetical protein EDB82DRAFT_529782 [Fusarium venenatum]